MGKLFNSSDMDINIDADDFSELKNRTYRQFGWPKVNIEISDDDFKYIIKRALMHLSTWAPKIEYAPCSVSPYVSDYTLSDYEFINGVLDIYVSSGYLIGLGIPIQTLMGPVMSLSASQNSQVVTDYMSLISAYNTAKQVWQVEPFAELIGKNTIRVTPTPYMNDLWYFMITLNQENNMGTLLKWEKEWLIRYCQCGVGKMIGQIRRKYDGVTLPVGSLSTSGNSLYSENDEMEKQLMTELMNNKKFGQQYIAIG